MALALGGSVIWSTTAGTFLTAPTFGVIIVGGAAPWTVGWETGVSSVSWSDASLDEVAAADAAGQALIGQRVKATGFSSDMSGVVVRAFVRNPDTDNASTVIVRNLQNGQEFMFGTAAVTLETA